MIVIFQRLGVILVGSLLIGIGINGFLVPHKLLDGGLIGLALILHYYFGFQTGLCMLVLSMPLCLYAWLYERTFFYNSLQGMLASSLLIDWLAPLRTQFLLPILVSAILGGTIIGIGIGLMLRYETSTGGTDLLAQFISKASSLNVGIIIFIIDGFVVSAGFSTLGAKSFVFSCLSIFIVGIITSILVKQSN
ncbi:YitT family protein [Siminovitchia sediminis]|uniref:YitT family protein n=1 Tax=Siminovitchia sediminis TaxID=1274353 RepID=A0ABW4KHR2_9BACI